MDRRARLREFHRLHDRRSSPVPRLLTARRLGYWQADQYINFGLCGLALPLKDRKGQCQYALSVTVQRQMHPDDQMVGKLLPVLREVAQSLRPII